MALYKRSRFTKRPRRERNVSDRAFWRIICILGAIVLGSLYVSYKHYIG